MGTVITVFDVVNSGTYKNSGKSVKFKCKIHCVEAHIQIQRRLEKKALRAFHQFQNKTYVCIEELLPMLCLLFPEKGITSSLVYRFSGKLIKSPKTGFVSRYVLLSEVSAWTIQELIKREGF